MSNFSNVDILIRSIPGSLDPVALAKKFVGENESGEPNNKDEFAAMIAARIEQKKADADAAIGGG